jgi:Rrf2 family protein
MRKGRNEETQLSFLSTTARHALRAVLVLANRADGVWLPAQEIAEALDAPANYLSKVLRLLAQKGLLESSRGPHGGFRLAMPASEITLADVLEVIDDSAPSAICLLGDRPCDLANPCVAHDRWTEVKSRVMEPLHGTTIADFVTQKASA